MNVKNFAERIGTLISQNQIPQAIKEISQVLKNAPQLNELIVHSARYNDLKKQIRLGTISNENAQTTQNKILIALLELSDEIVEFSNNNSMITEEVNDAISRVLPQQNTITINNTHSGNGDIIVGGNKIINNHL